MTGLEVFEIGEKFATVGGDGRVLVWEVDGRGLVYLQPTVAEPREPTGLLYTIAEVAARLSVSTSTVHHWIKDGELDAFRIGKSYRITSETLEEFRAKIADGALSRTGGSIDE